MGAEGFIVDPTDGIEIEVRCWKCGRNISPGDPAAKYHTNCIGLDGRLAISIDIFNYEER